MSSACQCHIYGEYCFYCEVHEPEVTRLEKEREYWRSEAKSANLFAAEVNGECVGLYDILREIDTHIRATSDPIPHIVATLKRVLPEYAEESGDPFADEEVLANGA